MNKTILDIIHDFITDKWDTGDFEYCEFCKKYCITEGKFVKDYFIAEILKNGDVKIYYSGNNFNTTIDTLKLLIKKYTEKEMN